MRQRAIVPLLLLLGMGTGAAWAQDRVDDFRLNCTSCHTIGGGRLVGPDLHNVGERKDRAWLARFIVDPQGVIDSGDAYAMKLLEEARGVKMTAVPGMTLDRAMNPARPDRSRVGAREVAVRGDQDQRPAVHRGPTSPPAAGSSSAPAGWSTAARPAFPATRSTASACWPEASWGPTSTPSSSGSTDARGWRRGFPLRRPRSCSPSSATTP